MSRKKAQKAQTAQKKKFSFMNHFVPFVPFCGFILVGQIPTKHSETSRYRINPSLVIVRHSYR
jgi:hypothetical protein